MNVVDRTVTVLVVGALVVVSWLGLIIRGKNQDIARLEERITVTTRVLKDARADAKAAVEQEKRRFELFRDYVAEDAQRDVSSFVLDAALIGGMGASDCLPGYVDPLCDNWYDPPPVSLASSWLDEFALGHELEHYGSDLVTRAAEDVEATLRLESEG